MNDANGSPVRYIRRIFLWKKLLKTATLGLVVVAGLLIALVAIPVLFPATGAQMADLLRTVFGPGPVADIESYSFQMQDLFNRTRYQVTGEQPALTFTEPDRNSEPTIASVATRAPQLMKTSFPDTSVKINGSDTYGTTRAVDADKKATPAAIPPTTIPTVTPSPDVIYGKPYIPQGWQPIGPVVSGQYLMARGSVKPDPTRPYAQAAVVRIDLSKVDLHFVLGTNEPVAAKGTQRVKRTGVIPLTDQSPDRLLVAFNGGFKSIHGNYGVIVNGTTVITPINGMATLAIYSDGSIDLGAWGRDINPGDNLVDARQNCPLLIDGGQINPTVNDGSRKEWGYTVKNLDTTWRSGVGLTQDGKFLIYAAGPALTVATLAHALQMAGSYHAMQLDINGYYTRFAIYQVNTNVIQGKPPVTALKLLDQMTVPQSQFLNPYDRDFFYVTLHEG